MKKCPHCNSSRYGEKRVNGMLVDAFCKRCGYRQTRDKYLVTGVKKNADDSPYMQETQ